MLWNFLGKHFEEKYKHRDVALYFVQKQYSSWKNTFYIHTFTHIDPPKTLW